MQGWLGAERSRQATELDATSLLRRPGMFDTLAVAQQLAAGGVAREQAEGIAGAIHDGLEPGEHVTADQFGAGLAVGILRFIE